MKVRVNKAGGKKYFHDLTHEVTSTSSFGFLQPIVCRELIAQDTVDLRVGQTVWLATMPKPTFGRLNLKTYHVFVPCVEIWHAFEQFLSGQSYHGYGTQYTPVAVPEIPIGYYTSILQYMSVVELYKIPTPSITSSGVGFSSLSNVPTASIAKAKTGFLTRLSELGGMNYNNLANTSRLNVGSRMIYTYTTVPSEYTQAPVESDWVEFFQDEDNNWYVAFGWYTPEARNIRKVLIGCGYQLNDSHDTLSLLPLVAYYKAWFDLFMPARDMTWKETHAFSFMERVEQGNLALFSSWINDSQAKDRFEDFFVDLAYCYYTSNPDYVSAHITGASLPIASNASSFSVLNNIGTGTETINIASTSTARTSPGTYLTQNKLDVLKKMYQYVNAATAIGGRVKEFMRSVFDATSLNDVESNFIGSQIMPITLTSQYSSAETSQGSLGELAGKGLGDWEGKTFKYTAKQQGYLISICCFVPISKYAQAIDPQLKHKTKFDFYTQSFDSLTLIPNSKYCIYGNKEIYVPDGSSPDDYGAGFGNITNYMEYKIAYNKLNGDMSRCSARQGFLPYTLDRLLPYTQRFTRLAGFEYGNVPSSLLVAGSRWRYIGKDEFIGWYNRMFVNSGDPAGPQGRNSSSVPDVDDNFVFYNFIDLKVHSFALPVADSYQTGAEGESFEVEKA